MAGQVIMIRECLGHFINFLPQKKLVRMHLCPYLMLQIADVL